MTPWESVEKNPRGGVSVSYLSGLGYTSATYNALTPPERAEIMRNAKFGSDIPNGVGSFVRDWAGYAADEAMELVQGVTGFTKWLVVGALAIAASVMVVTVSKWVKA